MIHLLSQSRARDSIAGNGQTGLVPQGMVLTWYQILGLFRGFLAERGSADWEVGSADQIQGLDGASLEEFVQQRTDLRETATLAVEARGELPSYFDYSPEWKRIVPENVLYRFDDAVCLTFAQLDYDTFRCKGVFVAAPDREHLQALVKELDVFCVRRQRESEQIQVIGGNGIARDNRVSWEDLFLAKGMKEEIRAHTELFLRGREAFDHLGVPYRRGFLFVGPPGNGKTTICRVVVAQAGLPCLYLMGSRPSSRNNPLEQIFGLAERLAPCVVVFEDVDSLLEDKADLAYFLNRIDGFRRSEGLLILATTNHPEQIDPALLNRPSRFDRIWKIGNPDLPCRRAYLGHLLGRHLVGEEIEQASEATEGFSYAFLKEVYIGAAQAAMAMERENGGGSLRLTGTLVQTSIRLLRTQCDNGKRGFEEAGEMGFGV